MGKLKLSTKQKLPQFHLGLPLQAPEEKTVTAYSHGCSHAGSARVALPTQRVIALERALRPNASTCSGSSRFLLVICECRVFEGGPPTEQFRCPTSMFLKLWVSH